MILTLVVSVFMSVLHKSAGWFEWKTDISVVSVRCQSCATARSTAPARAAAV
eukprot:COSAG01_NODE_10084_length_2253_cov_2.121170_2_plen_52_part_00